MEPFHIERFMIYEGRRLISLVLRGRSKPGILEEATDILAGYGIDINYLHIRPVRYGERGYVLMFLDFTGADVEPETLREELEALDFIEEAEIIEPRFKGFIADEALFPVMLGPHRAIILSQPALRGFLIDFRRRLGSGGEAMLYHIGREVGEERARHVNQIAEGIGVEGLRDRFIMGVLLLQCLGYGVAEITEFSEDPPYLKGRLHRCIECELGRTFNEVSDRPYSHYVRGILAGYASQLFQRDMFAEETRCLAMGDPYCEFEVRVRSASSTATAVQGAQSAPSR